MNGDDLEGAGHRRQQADQRHPAGHRPAVDRLEGAEPGGEQDDLDPAQGADDPEMGQPLRQVHALVGPERSEHGQDDGDAKYRQQLVRERPDVGRFAHRERMHDGRSRKTPAFPRSDDGAGPVGPGR